MPHVFVDTSAFYALADASDRHHSAVTTLFVARGSTGDLVTSDHVFVETWMLVNARLGRAAAMRYWDAMTHGTVTVLGVDGNDVTTARRICAAWKDQAFSLVDATSFAIMLRHGIDDALAVEKAVCEGICAASPRCATHGECCVGTCFFDRIACKMDAGCVKCPDEDPGEVLPP